MKRRVVFPLVLAVIVLGALTASLFGLGLSLAGAVGAAAAGPVYTVAQARANLTRQAAAWVGRTILVRGTLQGPFVFCLATRPCPRAQMGLVDDGNGIIGSDQYLPLASGPADSVRAFLRHVPLLGLLIPAPQRLRFGFTATYRLQLQREPSALCRLNPLVLCYQGVIVDAESGAW